MLLCLTRSIFRTLSFLRIWGTGPWRRDGPLRSPAQYFHGVAPMTHKTSSCQPMTSQSLYWKLWAGKKKKKKNRLVALREAVNM